MYPSRGDGVADVTAEHFAAVPVATSDEDDNDPEKCCHVNNETCQGGERGREEGRGREGGNEGGREEEREGGRERGREGRREVEREGGRDGGKERGREEKGVMECGKERK